MIASSTSSPVTSRAGCRQTRLKSRGTIALNRASAAGQSASSAAPTAELGVGDVRVDDRRSRSVSSGRGVDVDEFGVHEVRSRSST